MIEQQAITKTELLTRIEQGWDNLQQFLETLTPNQLDTYTDAVGWTVKDHLTHLMTWEDGIYALLNQRPR